MIPAAAQDLIERLRLIAEAEREMAEICRKTDQTKPLAPEFRSALTEMCENTAIMLDRIADEIAALSQTMKPH